MLAAVVVTPLYFNPASQRVFEPDKLAWVACLGLAAGVALAVRALEAWLGSDQEAPSAATRPPGRWPGAWPLWLAAALATVVLVLATAGSVLPAVSLWGSYRRGLGLVALLALLALFAATAVTGRGPAAMGRLRRALLLPVVPVAAYALLQRLGVDSVPWQVAGDQPHARAFGPMGNPILLGAYLAMILPLALAGLGQAWQDRTLEPARRRLVLAGHGLVVAFGAAALLASQSRGPLVGLLAGLGMLAVLWAACQGRRRLSLALVVTGLALVAVVVALSWVGLPGLGRLGSLLDPSSRTAQERALVWHALADLAAADPGRALRGYGPDTLMYVLPPHLPDELIRLTGDQTFDRAHNVVWEWWLTAGVAGVATLFLLYLAALVTGFGLLGLWRTRRQAGWLLATLGAGTAIGAAVPALLGAAPLAALGAPLGLVAAALLFAALARPDGVGPPDPSAWLVMGALAALVAHLVEGALGLPTASAELTFWVLLGALAALAARNGPPPRPEAPVAAWSEGVLDGLALAAIAFAPLLLPRAPTRSPAAGWPLWLLPILAWLAADLLTASSAAGYRLQAAARLSVLGAFVALFLVLGGGAAGPATAFGLVLAGAVSALAYGLSARRPATAGGEAWRWVVVASLSLLAVLVGWRFAVAPVLADSWLRAGLEAAVTGDRAAAAARFTNAEALWPQQPGFATFIAARKRDDFLNPALSEAEREAAFQAAVSVLQGALTAVPDDAVALRLANLYRDRGDLLPDGALRQQAWSDAERYYLVARRIFPRNPSILLEHAQLLERAGPPFEAGTAFQEVTQLQPSNVAAWAGLARLAVAAGDFDAADAAIRRALEYRRDHPEEVASALDSGTVLGAEDPMARQAGILYLAATEPLAATRQALDELRSAHPDDPGIVALAAWLDRRLSE